MPKKPSTRRPAPQPAVNKQLIANAIMQNMFGISGYNPGSDAKHTRMYAEYGYPTTLTFENYYDMFERNGLAAAGVNRAIETCWQEYPTLLEYEDTHDETSQESDIADHFKRLNFWGNLVEADRYSRIGEYAGVIFRFRDGKRFDEPVDSVSGGLDGIAEIIPVMQSQLKPSAWITDPENEYYGKVAMYQFQEAAMDTNMSNMKVRQFQVHPDRVHIWSKDFTVWGRPVLKAGFNDLLTIQKIIGAGGEGFWKNAKSAPVLQMDKEAKAEKLAQFLGVKTDEIADAMDEIVSDWQKGYDQMLMLHGMEAKTINVQLPLPEQFIMAPLQSYAASLSIPLKILLGSQSGERASTEDAKEWNKTCNSRRNTYIKPNVMRIIEKLVKYGVLPDFDWYLLWPDLTESTTEEKMALADKMAAITDKLVKIGMQGFTDDEIREVAGWEPLALPKPKRDKTTDRKTLDDLPTD